MELFRVEVCEMCDNFWKSSPSLATKTDVVVQR